jgi:hypothetical protein
MLSTKNISPRQLSFSNRTYIICACWFFSLAIEKDWRWGLGSFIVILGGSYYLISFMSGTFYLS